MRKKKVLDKSIVFDKVTIVISATDETDSLAEIVDTTISKCDTSDIACFLIVVPQNTDRQCLDVIEALKEKYAEQVKCLVQEHPYIGGALRDAVDATESSHILFFSADIPANLESIVVMIQEAKANPGTIVKVSRWLEKDSFFGYNKARLFFNFWAQKFLKVLFCSKLTEFTTPILIAPTDIYKRICFNEWNFPCLLEAVLIPVKMGFKITEIPAKCLPRTEGKSKNSALQTALYLKTALRVRFTPKSKLYKH